MGIAWGSYIRRSGNFFVYGRGEIDIYFRFGCLGFSSGFSVRFIWRRAVVIVLVGR